MLCDDYLLLPHKPAHERPQMAIDLFLESIKNEYEMMHNAYQLCIKKI